MKFWQRKIASNSSIIAVLRVASEISTPAPRKWRLVGTLKPTLSRVPEIRNERVEEDEWLRGDRPLVVHKFHPSGGEQEEHCQRRCH